MLLVGWCWCLVCLHGSRVVVYHAGSPDPFVVCLCTTQMEYLLSHIEKLMNHLKHEASAKVKAYGAASKYDSELEALRNRNAILAQRNATRERVISELRVRFLFS